MDVKEVFSAEMPIGSYSSCEVSPTCGLYGPDGSVGNDDREYSFYLPERIKAGLLWTSSGYVEYKFANGVPDGCNVDRLSFPRNCVPKHRDTGKTGNRILLCGLMEWIAERGTCPGDFGARRGRLMPPDWPVGSTTVRCAENMGSAKGRKLSEWRTYQRCYDRHVESNGKPYIKVRIGIKKMRNMSEGLISSENILEIMIRILFCQWNTSTSFSK